MPDGSYSGVDTLCTKDEVAVEAWHANALHNKYRYISVVAEIRIEKEVDGSVLTRTAYWALFEIDLPA
jgi:hypothetical protein